ncbi:nudC domain-containing protein 1 [Anopheles cruzii]|uniref:nudC domain-containing protein 1 n=1 Tax=Anopheles cruzii TaxID=68878 RepID=UPI0022EC8776|nr:nudC domain-containing protein 1 [Anopheles cruzii]
MRQTELRPDRKLLKSNFDGYKVSLDTIPVLRTELPTLRQAHRTHPNKHQYSYHHARLFGLHNHLVRDPWNSGHCYFVDVAGLVQRVQYEPRCGRIKPLSHVYKLCFLLTDNAAEDAASPYNCSLVFISERIGLLADGKGMIHVLDTGDRTTGSKWKAESVLPEQGDTSHLPIGGSILLDAQLAYADNGQPQIHAIALQVQQNLEHSFEPVLFWFRLDQRQEGSVEPTRRGAQSQLLRYGKRKECSGRLEAFRANRFEHHQLDVGSTSPEENVPESESPCLDGTVETSRDSLSNNLAPNLDTPLEECDFGEADGEEQYFTLERIARDTCRVTNRVSLGTGPPLFSVRMRPAAPEALVLRYDVDALLWQPQAPPTTGWTVEGDEWNLLHEGTLQAFGYVQASKRRQKYLACAPDLRYAVICESERLLFIYRSSHHGSSQLRQRNGPQVSIGQQHLVSLDDGSEIIGICCENEAILLLTEKSFFTVQLEIEE